MNTSIVQMRVLSVFIKIRALAKGSFIHSIHYLFAAILQKIEELIFLIFTTTFRKLLHWSFCL